MLFELNVRGADGLNRSEKDRKRGKEGGRERQVSRMEASNTWCCNKAEWIVEEEETQERRRGVVLQSLLRRVRSTATTAEIEQT